MTDKIEYRSSSGGCFTLVLELIGIFLFFVFMQGCIKGCDEDTGAFRGGTQKVISTVKGMWDSEPVIPEINLEEEN